MPPRRPADQRELHRRRRRPSTTPPSARARLPELATGLHLVLCDGRAASPPGTIPGLADADGRFEASPARAGLRYWWRRRELRPQLERELRAQLERFAGSGPAPRPRRRPPPPPPPPRRVRRARSAARRVPRAAGCACSTRTGWPAAGRRGPTTSCLRSSSRSRGAPATARPPPARERPARVYGLRATGRLDEAELARLIRGLRAPTVEIYLHPSRGDAAGRAEEAALCSAAVRQALKESGYRLTSTRRLGRAEARA